jgi:addiction module HigA family antidote
MASLLEEPHPGEILKQQCLEGIGMSQNQFANAIGVPPNRIHDIVCGRGNITADTDLRLGRFFGLSGGSQNVYDLMEARRGLGATIEKIVPYMGAGRRV